MEKFNILKGIPANLPMINVDTDMIIPKQFLKTVKRSGLGKSLFFEMRYDEQGKKIDNFYISNGKPGETTKKIIKLYNYHINQEKIKKNLLNKELKIA